MKGFRMIRIFSAVLMAGLISAPATAQQFGGVQSILEDDAVRIEVEGVNARNDGQKSALERELDDYKVYSEGGFHGRNFGGDTHRNRAALSGGNIVNIFNLFGGDDE